MMKTARQRLTEQNSTNGQGPKVPVFDSDSQVINQLNEQTLTAVAFVKIDNFGKLCTSSQRIDGSSIFKHILDQCNDLTPQDVQAFRLPRTGFIYVFDSDSVETDDEIEEFVQRLVNGTKSPLEIDGRSFNVSLSIGIAKNYGDDYSLGLLDRAQFAQSGAAEQDGSAYEYYDPERAKRIRDEVSLKNDIYQALENDEFYLEYQPVVSLKDFSIIGAEALLRWEHPERGTISPGEFIPLAEKTGQILFLDRWVIKTAVKKAAEWSNRWDQDIPLGVNISAWQFRDDFLVDKLEEILTESGLDPSLIKIEVTETSMMKDVERTADVLRSLKDIGVRISLDDFGTGHATFEYLSQFPIDELKIDRSFLNFDDVYAKNQKLVDMMIQTGKRVGTDILAEGIETPEQLDFLKNRGCEKAQGFLFSKPLPYSDFEFLVGNDERLHEQKTDSN